MAEIAGNNCEEVACKLNVPEIIATDVDGNGEDATAIDNEKVKTKDPVIEENGDDAVVDNDEDSATAKNGDKTDHAETDASTVEEEKVEESRIDEESNDDEKPEEKEDTPPPSKRAKRTPKAVKTPAVGRRRSSSRIQNQVSGQTLSVEITSENLPKGSK